MEKKIANSRMRLTGLFGLSVLCLVSCSQNSDLMPDQPTGQRHEIVLASSLGDIGGEVEPATRADADPAKAMEIGVARRDRAADGTWPKYLTGAEAILTATRAAGTGAQKITFTIPQYYSMAKLYGKESENSYNETGFLAWYPNTGTKSSLGDVPCVYFDMLDGTKDFMLAKEAMGSYTSQFTTAQHTLTFEHLMAKITVQIKATETAAIDRWDNITAIKVKDQYASAYLRINEDPVVLEWRGMSKLFLLENFKKQLLTVSYQTAGQLFVRAGGTTLTFTVTSEKGGDRDVTVTLTSPDKLTAGKAYTVSLDFKSTTVVPSATISDWTPAAANPPAIDL